MSKHSTSSKAHRQKATTDDPCLRFDDECTKFTPVQSGLSAFYDENNKEIITVTSGVKGIRPNTTEENQRTVKIVFQPTHKSSSRETLTLHIPDKGKITSVKLNPARNILAYKRAHSELVEFYNINTISGSTDNSGSSSSIIGQIQLDQKSYNQPVKAKNSILIGFVWTTQSEIVFISDNSVEYYHVERNKRLVSSLKFFPSATNWFAYQPLSKIGGYLTIATDVLMISTGARGNEIQPYRFNGTTVTKLQRFQVDSSWARDDSRFSLLERGVTIGVVYGQVRLLVLQQQHATTTASRVVVYTVTMATGVTQKTHVLDLTHINYGRFALHIVDDLIVVHDQVSQGSVCFDIMVQTCQQQKSSQIYTPIDIARSIAKPSVSSGVKIASELYSSNWVMFPPNVVVDAKCGILWTITLDLTACLRTIKNSELLIQFLAYRTDATRLLIKKCEQSVLQCFQKCLRTTTDEQNDTDDPLGELTILFENFAQITAPSLKAPNAVSNTAENNYKTMICQSDIYNGVFCQFDNKYDNRYECLTFISAVIFEYIYSLQRCNNVPIDFSVIKLLIDCHIRQRKFYQLQQMFMSGLFDDSKQLACLLLSLADTQNFPMATQLALDMLNRLPISANEEIVEVLLSKRHLMRALAFLESTGTSETASARQFLAKALELQDPSLFFTIFRYFEYRNLRLRGSASFFPGEQCDDFVEKFKSMFGINSLLCHAQQQ